MVLYDVYVRTILCYAGPVWATSHLADLSLREYGDLKKLCVLHRTFIKMLLGLDRSTRTPLLHIVSGRYPLKVILMKLCKRYFKRVKDIPTSDS